MPNESKIAAFTGHRPQSLPWGFNEEDPICVAFKKRLREEIEKAISEGYQSYLFGGAMGYDLIAARIVLDIKQTYPEIYLECIIPYINQAVTWPTEQQDTYYRILADCDKTLILSEEYHRDVYKHRNFNLVDRASRIIAGYSDKHGRSGTGQTVRYAFQKNKEVVVIDPYNF